MKLYISSSASSKHNLPEVLGELTKLGFKRIEITGNIKYSKDIEKTLLRYKKVDGVDFNIHNYLSLYPKESVLNLASCDSESKSNTFKMVLDIIRILKKLGKNLYTAHPGYKKNLTPELKDGFFIESNRKDNKKNYFYNNLEAIVDSVNDVNFKIAIENLHPKSRTNLYSFLCTPKDIKSFMLRFKNRPNIGMLLDLGHFNVAAKTLKFNKLKVLDQLFNEYADKIFAFHVSKNDGSKDMHGITDINSWQIGFLKSNNKYFKNVPVTLEWCCKAGKKEYRRYKILEEILNK